MPTAEARALALEPADLALLRALLAEHVPTTEVWAYGSRVTGGCSECSDLDLVVRRGASQTTSAGLRALRVALQESALPLLVDVHDWDGLPAAFRSNIEAAHVVVQAAPTA